ncbi:MAG: hypothetical protein IH594_14425 [Bacteroidales bacterium]|nr:hypothetical protein [Bacteroidales bacterium]
MAALISQMNDERLETRDGRDHSLRMPELLVGHASQMNTIRENEFDMGRYKAGGVRQKEGNR